MLLLMFPTKDPTGSDPTGLESRPFRLGYLGNSSGSLSSFIGTDAYNFFEIWAVMTDNDLYSRGGGRNCGEPRSVGDRRSPVMTPSMRGEGTEVWDRCSQITLKPPLSVDCAGGSALISEEQ